MKDGTLSKSVVVLLVDKFRSDKYSEETGLGRGPGESESHVSEHTAPRSRDRLERRRGCSGKIGVKEQGICRTSVRTDTVYFTVGV